ncbi:MAG: tRNA (guanosine(37)-N1)-methyltransferase TrmD [Clostridiales bacterium]|nr:tRNA (guanosine(37)-N1)-methyltransferase TrmD [Clostridiales bacterium]
MNFYVMTLFPEMIEQGMHTSITGRAIEKGLLSLKTVNIRDYSVTGNGRIDDYPYGGGAGMVMQAEPVCRAYEDLVSQIMSPDDESCLALNECEEASNASAASFDAGKGVSIVSAAAFDAGKETSAAFAAALDCRKKIRLVYLTPQGRVFDQAMAQKLACEENLAFLCGHYEGIDERVLDAIVTDYVSIGDYVLTGGELPAMVMMDAISRMVPGVLSNSDSGVSESFSDGLLEYPQYSRPEIWRGCPVPPVLLSGHHGNVDRWRHEQSLLRTLRNRPDLLAKAALNKEDRKFLRKLLTEGGGNGLSEEEVSVLQNLLEVP